MSTAPALAPSLPSATTPRIQIVRVHEIDGVRGWASLSVLLYHLFWELFGAAVPSFRSRALHFWLNGPLAVYIFFVLSGDALSWPFIATGDARLIDRTLLKRYFRLAIPIFLSCLITYLLMRQGLMFNREASLLIPNAWLGGFLLFRPSALSMLNFSFSQVFFDFASYPNSYNRFLWPMEIELAGSFLVFAFCYGVARRPQGLRITLVALAIAFLVSEYFGLFLAGVVFAQLRRRGVFERLRAAAFGRFVTLGLLALVVMADTLDYAWGLYLNASLQLPGRMDSLLAMVIVFCIYSNGGLAAFFANRVSRWLGVVSFPVYLLHFAVICSLTSFLIVRAAAAGHTGAATYTAIAAASAVVTLAAAWLFEGVERYCLRRVDRVVRTALG